MNLKDKIIWIDRSKSCEKYKNILLCQKDDKKLFTLRQQISSFWRLTFFSKYKNYINIRKSHLVG